MSSSVVYNLDYLKSKGFFEDYGELEIDGKKVIWDKDNYLAYVELENLEELEEFHKKLKKEYVRYEYFYYYIPKENKVKVFKRGCSVAFTYSDRISRSDVRESKKDKLNKFSPENLNVLFDTKDVMDRFYNELWQLRLEMAKSIKKPIKDKDKLLVVQHFMDRLVFFYFLCQLGIVKVKYSIDGESYEYTMNKQTTKEFFEFLIENLNDSELQKLLNSIFFEGLGNEHRVNSNGYVDVHVKVGEWEFDISVPYLNGGLFREKKITTENNTEIRESEIEFTGIKELIATLNKYNWVIGDYDEGDEESVLNLTPEILGHVYEKFVVGLENIGEDVKLSELKYDRNGLKYGRKKIGAYYTPEEITSYISENTIIPYLFDKLGLEKYNEMLNPRVAFDDFVENATEEELKKALEVLNNIKVLDPACGSGHFLVSAGLLLFDLKECICNKLAEEFGFERELDDYAEVKKIIVDNLYGVDISETAVEIAKLRLWLWLVSYLKNNENIEPLPNLEYNIKCGNSLIGWLNEKLEQLPLEYAYDDKIEGIFKGLVTFCKDKKKKEMLLKAKELLKSTSGNILDNYVEAFHLIYEIYKVSSGSEALHLKEILEDIRERVYKSVNFAYLNYINSKLKKKDRIKEDDLLKLKPLHWRIDFGWIIKNGGFDVVIGNPPYIMEVRENKDLFRIYQKMPIGWKYYEQKMDIFYFFIEQGIDLLKENGYLGFIVQEYWISRSYAKKLRHKVFSETTPKNFILFKDFKVFEDAKGQHNMILILKKIIPNYGEKVKIMILNNQKIKDYGVYNALHNPNQRVFNVCFCEVAELYDNSKDVVNLSGDVGKNIKNEIEKNSFYLDKKEIQQGIVTPQHNLTQKALSKLPNPNDYKVGQGIFVLSEEEYQQYNWTDFEREVLKPFHFAKELDSFSYNPKNNYYLIYTTKEIAKRIEEYPENYPNIKSHLDRFQPVITSDNKPYGLHRARQPEWFEDSLKIIGVRKTKYPKFAVVPIPYYMDQSVVIIRPHIHSDYNPYYICAILNSKLGQWLFYNLKTQGNQLQIDKNVLTKFPIAKLSKEKQIPFIILSQYAHFLRLIEKKRKISEYFKELMQIINSLVYELYFKEKFHEDGLYPEPKECLLEAISKYLKPINCDRWVELYWKKQLENNLTPEEEEKLKQLEEQNLKTIQKVYEAIKNDEEINKLIKKIKSHEWVKIIESNLQKLS